jgi:phage terminase large subunit GpA-like protein
MRAAADRETRVVVVRGGSQIAKTESLILNVFAYRTVIDPAPAMIVCPSQTAAQDFSHQRIEPLIKTCEPLKAVVTARETGPRVEGASTITFKTFAGGFLKLTGTLSASELSQVAVRDLYMTEVDRYAVETENREGSPVHLAKLRQRTFEHTSKLIMECSPTIAGESRIEIEYLNGTQEHYFLPCPGCGFEQELLRPGFDWESATYRCSSCGCAHGQEAWLSRVGRWMSLRETPAPAGIRSFWVPTWLSELVSWRKIGEDYRSAKELIAVGDKSNLKTWIQTTCAEPWIEEQQPAIRGAELLSRAEEYDAEVPSGALCLVACVDTQDLEVVYLISGIGRRKEVWLIEFGRIDGNLEREASAVYKELEARVLRRDWLCANGKVMRIKRCAQDSGGHHASPVFDYVKRFPHLMVAFRAVESRPGTPIWKRGKSHDERTPLLLGATSLAKDLLLNRLEIPVAGPGFIHIPVGRGFDEAWANEMTAERKEIQFRAGIRKTVWKRINNREHNDGWDLSVMTLILVESMKLRLEEMEPDYYEPRAEQEAQKRQQGQPTWGVMRGSGVPLPSDTNHWQDAGTVRPEDKPRPQWGVVNKPVQW